ncbi:MAG: S8 family serine peptidase [Hydrogenophaga sp.]|nr:S8 family serine peptidase [Hydrogenophaga sp.]
MRAVVMLALLLHGLWFGSAWAQTAGGGGGRGPGGASASGGGNRGGGNGGGGGFNRLQPAAPAPVAPAPQRQDVDSDQLLLLSRDFNTTRQVLATLAAESVLPVATARLRTLGWDLALFQWPDTATAQQRLQQWQQRFPQVSVDFNHLYRSQGGNEGREYALDMLGLPQAGTAAPAPRRDALRQVRIGLLDTRVEATDWLRQATLTRRPFIQDVASQPETPAHPAHGTAIASLVARVAPQVRLFAAEVMAARGAEAVTNSYRLIQGVDWLLSHRVQAINMSLAGRADRNLATTVDELMQRNVLVIAAAGNHGRGAPPAYPAAYAGTRAGMLAVTAVDADGRLYEQANQGAYVTLAAPGVQIWVPAAGGTATGAFGARYVSGTSYASAYAAGAVAQWLAMHPGQASAAATRRLRDTARDLGPTGRDEAYGAGLLQIGAALGP